MSRDPWVPVGKLLFWAAYGAITVKEAARLNWEKRAPKPSPGTETVRTD